ncbi:hypothetical protein ACH4E7_43925 [Kitasatospora sp. NPDC018058]|uniref:hypothetical protein n=1 Tax=Kitasatospora sp. NPDC018058 TaxID=3364025 RepID=UPI0037BE5561
MVSVHTRAGNPTPEAAATRDFERAVSELTAVNPLTGTTDSPTTLTRPGVLRQCHCQDGLSERRWWFAVRWC